MRKGLMLSVGLACLTKGTAYVFAPPLVAGVLARKQLWRALPNNHLYVRFIAVD